jgi:hypothetical protein
MFLDLAQAESGWKSFYRASVSVTITAGGAIIIPGSGRYKVLPNSGTADNLSTITLTGEVVEGTLIELRTEITGHIITLLHGANLHLPNGYNVDLNSVFSYIRLRHHGANVWAAEAVLDVP